MARRRNDLEPIQVDWLRLDYLNRKNALDFTKEEEEEWGRIMIALDLTEIEGILGPHPNRGKYT